MYLNLVEKKKYIWLHMWNTGTQTVSEIERVACETTATVVLFAVHCPTLVEERLASASSRKKKVL